jgi:hypothetical protein
VEKARLRNSMAEGMRFAGSVSSFMIVGCGISMTKGRG